MCSYAYSSSGVLIYNTLRSQPPFILQLSSRLRHHPCRAGKHSPPPEVDRQSSSRPVHLPSHPCRGHHPPSPPPIFIVSVSPYRCPAKPFSTWSLSRSHSPVPAGGGKSLRLVLASLWGAPPRAARAGEGSAPALLPYNEHFFRSSKPRTLRC